MRCSRWEPNTGWKPPMQLIAAPRRHQEASGGRVGSSTTTLYCCWALGTPVAPLGGRTGVAATAALTDCGGLCERQPSLLTLPDPTAPPQKLAAADPSAPCRRRCSAPARSCGLCTGCSRPLRSTASTCSRSTRARRPPTVKTRRARSVAACILRLLTNFVKLWRKQDVFSGPGRCSISSGQTDRIALRTLAGLFFFHQRCL